ncbi:T9SS type A sorting domain-containing protein [Rufibacter hautae]|uniref:T9SS type A sorting domain-containing protein n=1 Tax=Rufibacter hautae TaxID=2595005 RepID=A0A5B6TEB1_9BACT|nr:sialate O-acetylesterase [Rufibacter hautae]KAA3438809.1 T9SS type A sorting domain-containing protein [Rufibacter hautae]
MYRILSKFLSVVILSILMAPSAFAALVLNPIFGSHMVLQRGTSVPVFGTTNPGASVTVQFQAQNVTGVADANGKWRVNLASMTASTAPSSLVVTSGSETLTLTGVQVGEVWLCSGQSNMGFPLSNANDSAPAIASAGNHNIRLFRMTAGSGPATTTWKVSNSSTVGNFSAVGYWMGLELSLFLRTVPIGLIQATHDGTAIETWQHTSGGSGVDYDAMVKSIQPYAVKGVAWYQGESNGGDTDYKTKLTNMLREWRADWGQTSLPFGIIQLAYRSGWNSARNAQLEVADTEPSCFLVTIRDLPGGSLHPPVKKPVGIRTAIGARGLLYGDNIPFSAPVRDIPNSYVSGNKIILNWKYLGNGLFTSDGAAPGTFSVATATGQFKTAPAVIVGNTIEITSPVANATRVQYSYSSVGNLYSRVSIPTEGGASTVDRLKVSEFQITLAPRLASTATSAVTASELKKAGVSVYPNPSSRGQFNIHLGGHTGDSKLSVQISDLLGRVVYRKMETAGESLQVNSNLKPGTYLLQVRDNSQVLVKKQLVIQ